MIEGLRCVSNCMKIMVKDLRDLGLVAENSGAMLNKEILNEDSFEQYCE